MLSERRAPATCGEAITDNRLVTLTGAGGEDIPWAGPYQGTAADND